MAEKNPTYKRAIKKTLLYSSVFKYPLTYYQLFNLFIIDAQKELNQPSFLYELAKLINKQFVIVEDEKCYLPGVKYADWKKRGRTSKVLVRKNKAVFKILERIPWIKFIGITGSVAARNADKNDDLDIFVITKRNRVWITRGFLALILKSILKNYVKRGIDPNIFIDETNLEWPLEQRNVYVANEVIRMYPVIDKEDTYFKFLEQNKWIGEYMGNFKTNYIEEDLNQNKKRKKNDNQGDVLLNILDNLAMFLQKLYMKKKVTNEIAKKHFIHFNKKDSSNPILEKYQEKLSTI